jgi:hypothetical protein
MSFDPHSRRFDPRWLFPAIETDGEETSEAPDVSPFSSDEESTTDPTGRDIDEALEQIASAGCCVCPLCGALVASDGSVMN